MRKVSGPNIQLYIDQLILDGLPVNRIQAAQIQTAVEAELGRLLAEHGVAAELQAGGAVASIHANEIQLTRGTNPAQIGTQIAQSVYSGIGNKQ